MLRESVIDGLRAEVVRWRARFNLTPSEAQVLEAAVLRCDSLDEIAAERGTKRDTIKAQTNGICTKTGAKSLSNAAVRLFREFTETHGIPSL